MLMFTRMHTDHEYAGCGLGLPISEKVIQELGGSIDIESTVGQGSTFTVYFPDALKAV